MSDLLDDYLPPELYDISKGLERAVPDVPVHSKSVSVILTPPHPDPLA